VGHEVVYEMDLKAIETKREVDIDAIHTRIKRRNDEVASKDIQR
jgi:hypothetical protein